MKISRIVGMLSFVGLLAVSPSSWAFFGSGPKTDSNEQLGLLFGKNRAFSATAEMTVKGSGMGMEMDYAVLDGMIRSEMDMTKAKVGGKGGKRGQEGMEQMAAMGMNIVVTLVRPDKKATYIIYPGLKSYCEAPQTIAGQGTNAPPKIDRTELGKETIDGHPCVKYKVIVTMDDGKKFEMLTWQATDLGDFPIQSEMQSGGDTVLMHFKDIKLAKPAAGLFEVPPGLTKYNSVQEMMMGGMQRMMQQMRQ